MGWPDPILLGSRYLQAEGTSLPVFGTSPRPRRPILLILVYGAFLALVGITATAQAVMVGTTSRLRR